MDTSYKSRTHKGLCFQPRIWTQLDTSDAGAVVSTFPVVSRKAPENKTCWSARV
jgi:hypothetical protein